MRPDPISECEAGSGINVDEMLVANGRYAPESVRLLRCREMTQRANFDISHCERDWTPIRAHACQSRAGGGATDSIKSRYVYLHTSTRTRLASLVLRRDRSVRLQFLLLQLSGRSTQVLHVRAFDCAVEFEGGLIVVLNSDR